MAEAAPNPTAPTGQSPPGASPATQPVPNRGTEAAALAKLSVLVSAMMKLAAELGPSSEVGKDVLKCSNSLAKHVPPGSQSPGIENNAMMQMQRANQQNAPAAAMLAARGGGAAQAQAGGQPAPGGQGQGA